MLQLSKCPRVLGALHPYIEYLIFNGQPTLARFTGVARVLELV